MLVVAIVSAHCRSRRSPHGPLVPGCVEEVYSACWSRRKFAKVELSYWWARPLLNCGGNVGLSCCVKARWSRNGSPMLTSWTSISGTRRARFVTDLTIALASGCLAFRELFCLGDGFVEYLVGFLVTRRSVRWPVACIDVWFVFKRVAGSLVGAWCATAVPHVACFSRCIARPGTGRPAQCAGKRLWARSFAWGCRLYSCVVGPRCSHDVVGPSAATASRGRSHVRPAPNVAHVALVLVNHCRRASGAVVTA